MQTRLDLDTVTPLTPAEVESHLWEAANISGGPPRTTTPLMMQ